MTRSGFVAAVQRNSAAVVQVVTLRGARDPMEEDGFEFFQPLAGLPLPGGDTLERTFSSGFVIAPDGLVVASAHAVFDAREVWVLTSDSKRYRGKVVAYDRGYDVALVKIDAAGLPVVHTEPAPAICPGSWIAAIGTPFGFDRTVTAGVVSAYPRYLHGSSVALIQTDAALNPGSSGGPLFDADGVLVGMSTMIFSANGIYIGVSFALPVDELMRVVESLRTTGRSHVGDIGARTQPLTPDLARAFGLNKVEGALVVKVEPGSAADRAGLRAGDVVLGLARGERTDHPAIEAKLSSARPGTQFDIDVWRNSAVAHATLKVDAASDMPAPQPTVKSAPQEMRLGLVLTIAKIASGPSSGLYVDGATGSALLAGLEHGDRVLAVNGMTVSTLADFDAALAKVRSQPVVALLVIRGGAMAYVPVPR
jgi:serine protease Do